MFDNSAKLISIRSAFGVLALMLTVALIACSDGSSEVDQAESDGRLRVVTTVSPITSLVENIGGTRIRLEGIIPEGLNSHTYEPAPSVARLITEADLIEAFGEPDNETVTEFLKEQLGGTNSLLPAANALEGYQANVIALKANEAVNTRKRVEIAVADLTI